MAVARITPGTAGERYPLSETFEVGQEVAWLSAGRGGAEKVGVIVFAAWKTPLPQWLLDEIKEQGRRMFDTCKEGIVVRVEGKGKGKALYYAPRVKWLRKITD